MLRETIEVEFEDYAFVLDSMNEKGVYGVGRMFASDYETSEELLAAACVAYARSCRSGCKVPDTFCDVQFTNGCLIYVAHKHDDVYDADEWRRRFHRSLLNAVIALVAFPVHRKHSRRWMALYKQMQDIQTALCGKMCSMLSGVLEYRAPSTPVRRSVK